jgi:ubiquinone/menaquinone biosynthesis C-methylase UbiE
MEVDFNRERDWWDAKAPDEEQDLADEAINRALRWREVERHLAGVRTVLDVGAGTGAFSIPLAQRGFAVTHVDFSPAMLTLAREKAEGLLRNVQFVEANATALPFPDRSFDLVLNMDGAISFCGSLAEQALQETCRVTRKKLILTASHWAWMIPIWVSASIKVAGRILPAVEVMFERGEWHQEQFLENPLLSKGVTQDYFPGFRAFLPGELRDILEEAGMRILRCGGLGTLANLCGPEAAEQVCQDENLFQDFVDLCERFDLEVLPDGPGTRQRAGLIAVAVLG